MNKKDVLFIMEAITLDPYFKDYRIRKSDNAIYSKSEIGWQRIVPHYYNTYDLSRNELALEITPFYEIRFNVLHKWFEKYSKKQIKTQRDDCSLIFVGDKLGTINEFYFLENRKDFDKDLKRIKEEVTAISKVVFSKYTTLEGYYDYCIGDVLKGERKLPDVSFEWVIEYLIVTRLVAPSYYEKIKRLVLEQVDFMKRRNEPNVKMYYNELPVILEDLENTDFSSDKWK